MKSGGPRRLAGAAPQAPAAAHAALGGPEVLRQLLDLPAGAAIQPRHFEVVARPWREAFAVVLVKGKDDDRVAALGLYAAGDTPWPSRLLARSGPLAFPLDETVVGLDLAPFRVTPTETAIGLRFARVRAYWGGGGQASVLRLYVRRDAQLEAVFGAVLEYSCLLAGSWNPDGSREHSERTGRSILDVSRAVTLDHFDLVHRSGATAIATFRWDGLRYARFPAPSRWGECEIVDDR